MHHNITPVAPAIVGSVFPNTFSNPDPNQVEESQLEVVGRKLVGSLSEGCGYQELGRADYRAAISCGILPTGAVTPLLRS